MPDSLLITNTRLSDTPHIHAHDPAWILCADGIIAAVGTGEPPAADALVIDAAGRYALPGFIDIHVHGAMGHEAMDATPDAIRIMARFYAQHGVVGFLPTTWSDTRPRITAALRTIAACMGEQTDGATVLGAHVEGPYLNPKRCGAQNLDYIRRADRDEWAEWVETGVVRLVSLAPEYEENHWLIADCVQRDVIVSAAHTDASYDQAVRAFALGVSHVTHMYNAMTPLNHREPGVVGAALTHNVTCELIADNIHVHPAAMRLLRLTKTAQDAPHLVLISDAIRGAGMPDGDYTIDERTVTIRDGAVRLPDGTLAGSTLTLDRAVHNFSTAAERSLTAVWACASRNPAHALRLDYARFSFSAGEAATFILVDSAVNVALTLIDGRIVWRSGV